MAAREPTPDDDGWYLDGRPTPPALSNLCTESIYNDGDGLQFSIELVLLPTSSGRSNAKRKTVKKSFYVHEKSDLNNMLNEAIKALGRQDTLTFCYIRRDDTYTSKSFDIDSLTYTIPKTSFKDMGLTCNKDYAILLKEATKKAAPETIKITMSEMKAQSAQSDSDEHRDSDDEDEPPRKKKKKSKSFEPTDEEVEQNELIKKLNAEWKCADRTCKRFVCFPDRVTAKHVQLTHFHLQTWATAIQGKVTNEDGTRVDLKNPPDDKFFDHHDPDPADLSLLRSRATNKANDSNITINLTLPDGALPLQPSNTANRPVAPLGQGPPLPQQQRRPRIAPQLSLDIFCLRFNLSGDIYEKLKAYSVTGPHTLRHLKDTHLEAANLNPAEIADVRDAQDRWGVGEGE